MADVSSSPSTAAAKRQAQQRALLDALVPLANEMSCLNHRRRCVESIAIRAHNTKTALRVDAAASYASGVRQLERSDGRIAAARRLAEERRVEAAEDRRAAREEQRSKHGRQATPSAATTLSQRRPASAAAASTTTTTKGPGRARNVRCQLNQSSDSLACASPDGPLRFCGSDDELPHPTASVAAAVPHATGHRNHNPSAQSVGTEWHRPPPPGLEALRALVAGVSSSRESGNDAAVSRAPRRRDGDGGAAGVADAQQQQSEGTKRPSSVVGPRYMRAKESGSFDDRAARLAMLDARRAAALRAAREAADEDRADALKGRRDREAAREMRLEHARAAQHERRSLLRSRTPGIDPPLPPSRSM